MMRWNLFMTTMALGANLLVGQDKPVELKKENFEAAIIPVKTLSGDSFKRLAALLNVFHEIGRASCRERVYVLV